MTTERPDYSFTNKWHAAINEYNTANKPFQHWLYHAKDAADEVPRLAMLFGMERNGKLAKVHHQCSHDSEGASVPDNHLSCAMGVVCRECPFLKAFDGMNVPPEQIDQIKAWTCVTHILTELGRQGELAFDVSTGFVVTVDDVMYWQRVHDNLTSFNDADDEDADQ